MCRSGLCTVTPAGGTMSPAVTGPGPCLRRYIVTGSAPSGPAARPLRVRVVWGACSLIPRHGGELVQHAVDADAGDGRPRDGGEQGAPERVAQRVAEARLEGLDDEPGAGVARGVLGQSGSLRNQHGCSSS